MPPITPRPWPLRLLFAALRFLGAFALGLALFAAWGLAIQLAQRPAAERVTRGLAPGVTYDRYVRDQPRRHVLHHVAVDLDTPGLRVITTDPAPQGERNQTAKTVSAWVAEVGATVGINAGFFHPFHADAPWDYYPRHGDPVDVHGLAIRAGRTWHVGSAELPVLCVGGDHRASIQASRCGEGTEEAVAGSRRLVVAGANRMIGAESVPQPRTAVGVSADGRTLHMVVVDGRQPWYSEGLRFDELAEAMIGLGVHDALNLDGGGSSALVAGGPDGPSLFSAPVQTRIPMRERAVATHLGVRFEAAAPPAAVAP